MSNYKESFEFEGKEYEIRLSGEGGRIRVRAYLEGQRANGYEYSMDEDAISDFARSTSENAIKHLVDLARSDVQNKVWESYLAAEKEAQ